MTAARKPPSPCRGFNSSPDIIRLAVPTYVRFPLSLRNVEKLLARAGYRPAMSRPRMTADAGHPWLREIVVGVCSACPA